MDYFDELERNDIKYNAQMFNRARDYDKFIDNLQNLIEKEINKLQACRQEYLKVLTNFIKYSSDNILKVTDKYDKQLQVVRVLRKVLKLTR